MKKNLLLLALLLTSFSAFCQFEAPPDEEEPIPIDGGISLLIASGVALATKSYFRKK